MADVTQLLQGRADAIEQRSIVRGFISTSRAAPTGFTKVGSEENFVWVIVPEHSTTVPYGPCNWSAEHGTTLPAQGAACLLALDQINKPVVVWWEGNQGEDEDILPISNTLPVSPKNGELVYYQQKGAIAESLMEEQGIVWALRYRSGSASTHKWEFVGGSTLWAEHVAVISQESNAKYTSLTGGPSITTPLTGDYSINFGTHMVEAEKESIFIAPSYGAGAVDTDSAWIFGSATNLDISVARTLPARTITATTAVVLQIKTAAIARNFTNTWVSIQPVRIG